LNLAEEDGDAAVGALPDPFGAQCPLCDHEAAYRKAAIRGLPMLEPE
jgi:hypothetical protein